jgi:5-methylcytosine-specific restriction endonuclease McrA
MISQKDNDYATLLNSDEWREMRNKILERDGFKCKRCNSPGTTWIPYSEAPGGTNVLIIENDPITEIPKTVESLDKPIYIHIHHKFYVIENGIMASPWDYKDDDLITVCSKCHEQIHLEEKVPIFEKRIKELIETNEYTLCPRCGGEGYLPEFIYHHNGICFQCMGNRVFKTIEL